MPNYILEKEVDYLKKKSLDNEKRLKIIEIYTKDLYRKTLLNNQ